MIRLRTRTANVRQGGENDRPLNLRESGAFCSSWTISNRSNGAKQAQQPLAARVLPPPRGRRPWQTSLPPIQQRLAQLHPFLLLMTFAPI